MKEISGRRSDVPLVVMSLFRIVFASVFILVYLHTIFTKTTVLWSGVGIVLLSLVTFSRRLRKRMYNIESKFLSNLNERELHRSGRENNLVSDLHMAFMTVGNDCSFVGEKLKNSDIRKRYGVNVVSITRGSNYYPVPTGEMRIFPGDSLAIIGTDEQIQHLLPEVEKSSVALDTAYDKKKVEFLHFELSETSPLLGIVTVVFAVSVENSTFVNAFGNSNAAVTADPLLTISKTFLKYGFGQIIDICAVCPNANKSHSNVST